MIPEITTLAPAPSTAQTKTILVKDQITGSLVWLESEDAILHGEARQVADHILYVAEGQVTVRIGDISTVLSQDQALFVPNRTAHTIAARPGVRAKLLRLEIPPRQQIVPQLITPGS